MINSFLSLSLSPLSRGLYRQLDASCSHVGRNLYIYDEKTEAASSTKIVCSFLSSPLDFCELYGTLKGI